MTKYHCVKCGAVREVNDGEDPGMSAGLCRDPCMKNSLITVYRRRQLNEGNFDCFAKATDHFCDQGGCKYRGLCLA